MGANRQQLSDIAHRVYGQLHCFLRQPDFRWSLQLLCSHSRVSVPTPLFAADRSQQSE